MSCQDDKEAQTWQSQYGVAESGEATTCRIEAYRSLLNQDTGYQTRLNAMLRALMESDEQGG